MLILTRRPNEFVDISVRVDDPELLKRIAPDGVLRLAIQVFGLNAWSQVKLGFHGAREITIDRREIALEKEPNLQLPGAETAKAA